MPVEAGDKARLELEFEKPYLLGALFGEYDQNLVAIENRLGVYIAARGNRLQIEGRAEAAARARDVLQGLYNRLSVGQTIDPGAVEAVIAMSAEPTLDGIIRRDVSEPPKVMIRTRKKTIVPRSANQGVYMEALARNELIFALGPAGTGKTYLAMAKAVQALQTKQVNRIILTRPAVEAGERLGFLPGTLHEKIDPYLRPLHDALHDMMDPEAIPKLMQAGVIEVAPLAYMRGRTLNDAFIILDEAQNTTAEQMKMFLTRLGFGAKIVVTGDVTQIDLPGGARSGLAAATEILEGIDDIHFARLDSSDVVRHRLVSDIVDAYGRFEAAREDGSGRGNRAQRRAASQQRVPRR